MARRENAAATYYSAYIVGAFVLNLTLTGFPGAPNNLMYSPPAMMSPMINRSPFTVPAMVPTNPQTRNYYSSGQYGAGFR